MAKHVMLQQPVHAGDANGAEQAADGDEIPRLKKPSAINTGIEKRGRRINFHGLERRQTANMKIKVSAASNLMVSAISVERLLAFCAFNQRNHSIQKSMSRIGGDTHFDFIRQDA